MRIRTSLATLALLAVGMAPVTPTSPSADADWARYVDPMVGSWVPGFTNPGPQAPHGMVQLGPDTEGPLNYGGYYVQNQLITGFSHTHMSAGVYQGGQFPLMPVVGPVADGDLADAGWPHSVRAYASTFSAAEQTAEAGYYRVMLSRYGVEAELTASTWTGRHRYTFPPGVGARVVFEPSRDLKGNRQDYRILVIDDRTLVATVDTDGPDHTVHAAIRGATPFVVRPEDSGTLEPGGDMAGNTGWAVLDFGDADVAELTVALSYTGPDGALRNLEDDPAPADFDEARATLRAAWNTELSRIEVTSDDETKLRSFYTALYHAQLFPSVLSDVDGRYIGPDDVVRHDDEHLHYTQFSLWDSYRGQNQLLAVIDPDRYEDFLVSMRDYADQSGELPRWQLANRNPGYMSGDPALMFIGEGVCRGIGDDDLVEELYDHMVSMTTRRAEYDSLGYLPTDHPNNPVELVDGGGRNAGKTLEFGVADMALAAVADALEEDADAARFAEQSLRYRNLLDPETRWIRPRTADGEWIEPFAPEAGYGFQEGTSWQYSWLVMQDLAGLVERMGGAAAVNDRLDEFFAFPASAGAPVAWPKIQNQATVFGVFYAGNQYAPGNEHDLEAPFVYSYAGAPWKTAAVARAAASIYTPTPDGLPGNDDLGALSGWLVWTMLGMYPVTPGTPVYVAASPHFTRAVIHRADATDLVIEAPATSDLNRFVGSARLGDDGLERAWVTEAEWADAGGLAFDMQALPNQSWGAGPDLAPPSLSTHPLSAFGCRAEDD